MAENKENIEQKDIVLDVDETKENIKEKEIKENNNNILSSNIEEHKVDTIENESKVSQNVNNDIKDNRCSRICQYIKECPGVCLLFICVYLRCTEPP